MLLIAITSILDLAISRFFGIKKLFIELFSNKILGFSNALKNRPKISKLFMERNKQKSAAKKQLDKESSILEENNIQGQGIQIVPFSKKKSVKRSRI